MEIAFKFVLIFFVCYGVCVNAKGTRTRLSSYRCTWGQDYWCKNIKNALECGAVQHCQENIWKSRYLDIDPCTLCELAIKRIKMIMDEETVQKHILEFLKDVCDNAGLGPFVKKCKEIVTRYEPIIIKNMDKLLENPKKVCTTMGMCKAKDKQVIIASLIKRAIPTIHLKSLPSGGLTEFQKCVMCKSIMTDLHKISKETKSIESPMQKVCSRMTTSNKEECEQALIILGSSIISLMKTNANLICMDYNAGLCQEIPRALHQGRPFDRQLEKIPRKANLQRDIACEVCVYLMTQAEDMIKNTSMTEKEFEKVIMVLCEEFKFMAAQCKAAFLPYLPLIYELLTKLKPYQVCQEIDMCPLAKLRKELRCILGASFWCANLGNAKQCNEVQYCKIYVWKNL